MSLILGIENKDVPDRTGTTRRVFPGASAASAVALPVVSLAGPASAATTRNAGRGSALPRRRPAADLRALLRQIDPDRIHATVLRPNVIATLQGTASPQRYYVVTGRRR